MNATIIANKIANGATGKIWMARKGWNKETLISHIVDFAHSGEKTSLYDYLEAK